MPGEPGGGQLEALAWLALAWHPTGETSLRGTVSAIRASAAGWSEVMTVVEVRHKDTGAVILQHADKWIAGTLAAADLSGKNLEGADLDEMVMRGARLDNASLAGAVMRRADLSQTHCRRADLREADLQAASLLRADLKEAQLAGANLTDTNLTRACLLGTRLRDARLDGADLTCAYYDEATEWPAGFEPQARGALRLGQPLAPRCAEYWQGQKYGPHMVIDGGSIAEPGEAEYRHRFGGDSWRVTDPHPVFGGPTLLLTLDLADPRLAALRMPGLDEIPLASYLNCDAGNRKQRFRIEPETRTLVMVAREKQVPKSWPEEYWFPNPLPETRIRLRLMTAADWPIDEESHDRIENRFLGGPDFIRVLGPPLWVEESLEGVKCTCGKLMRWICGLGYEDSPTDPGKPSAFVGGAGFDNAEAASQFFLCRECREVLVMPDISG
jgi:hypothetical protein